MLGTSFQALNARQESDRKIDEKFFMFVELLLVWMLKQLKIRMIVNLQNLEDECFDKNI